MSFSLSRRLSIPDGMTPRFPALPTAGRPQSELLMRVVIADDYRDSALTLAVLLRNWGFEPIVAHDGLTALEMLRQPDAPTLAILDWIMPGMDGIEICRQLRKETDRPYTYVILVTGRGTRQQMVEGLEAGADDFLVKPADPDELHARIITAKRLVDLQAQLLVTQRLLREQATRDALTGLWNRAMIMEILQRELPRAQREGHPLATLMLDIDHFKEINDTHGHLAGDHVLQCTAQRLLGTLRPYDTVGRYGGEEFLIVLPGCGPKGALALAERLRQSVCAEPMLENGKEINVTMSVGLADWDGLMSPRDLLRVTDEALYEAKRAGRNRVARVGPKVKL